ncbi:MAG: tRNA(Ile)-lysidine synthetase [Actinomycetota bacterium]
MCRGPAVIDVARHNANFCVEHFLRYCRQQVERAIKDFDMLTPGEKPLVAVSGGKDSLAVWDLLGELGYEADGLYIGLGIGEYSDTSGRYTREFAAGRGLKLIEIDLRDRYDYDIPTAAAVTRRVPCSSCGLSKRHLFDSAALDGGYDAVVTGHNLDDEAAVLFGNVLRWQNDYLGRQRPVLPAGNGFPRKIKPLVRLTERETAAYCVLRGIDYMVEECPMAAGNKHLHYKEALNDIELRSPGTKADFYFSFLRRAVDRFAEPVGDAGAAGTAAQAAPDAGAVTGDAADETAGAPGLGTCARCGGPAGGEVCAFCRLTEQVAGREPVPVELVRRVK